MVCIYCGAKTKVGNSRLKKVTNQTWRRRVCSGCKAAFTTIESPNFDKSLTVKNNAGHLKPFERDKLYLSIYNACGHRKTATRDATALTATVIGRLLTQIESAMLTNKQITEATFQVLKRFDKVAAVAYDAYHS